MVARAAAPAASRWCSSARPSSVSHAPSMQNDAQVLWRRPDAVQAAAQSLHGSQARTAALRHGFPQAAWQQRAARRYALKEEGCSWSTCYGSSCLMTRRTQLRCNSHALTTTAAKHTQLSYRAARLAECVWHKWWCVVITHTRARAAAAPAAAAAARPRGESALTRGWGGTLRAARRSPRESQPAGAQAATKWTHPPCRPRTSASSAPPGTWAPATARRPRRSPRRPQRW